MGNGIILRFTAAKGHHENLRTFASEWKLTVKVNAVSYTVIRLFLRVIRPLFACYLYDVSFLYCMPCSQEPNELLFVVRVPI